MKHWEKQIKKRWGVYRTNHLERRIRKWIERDSYHVEFVKPEKEGRKRYNIKIGRQIIPFICGPYGIVTVLSRGRA